jgi:dTDP-4-dehydrorhamnose reductase
MIPIIGTGLSGLIGSKLMADFSQQYEFAKVDVADPVNPVDITKLDSILEFFNNSSAEFVVHFAAYTDVTGAWQQSGDKNGLAYQVNVLGTQNIVHACEVTHKHLIHVSTAYVFNGENENMYQENEPLSPIEWYGQTKAWAEEAVTAAKCPWTILRIDQPFRSDAASRPDVVRRIIASIKDGTLYPQFNNHYMGPTFIDDFVKIIDWVIRKKMTGIYHASSGEKWSDFEFATLINQSLNLKGNVKSGDLFEYLKTAKRPYQKNTALDCSKLVKEIDFKMLTVKEAVGKIVYE